ncbi:MAG: DMT family transporter [Alphaproteobacteria bacterium]|nr:DMT family transporter [Alphaproteobacteria bacterium]
MSPMTRLAPPLFVLLWSSAFISAKYGLPDADPITFLFVRFVLVACAFGAIALVLRSKWPTDPKQIAHIAVFGALVQGVYLSGVFLAISKGLPAGIASLIVGLQPILTALLASQLLSEQVRARQWLGLALGVSGVVLVLWERASLDGLQPVGIALCLGSLICISYGTIHQKRYCGNMDLVSGSVIQALTASIVTGVAAYLLEPMRVTWSLEFSLALGWLVVGVSLGAFSLLMTMIKRGEAVKVISLFYMVPPTTAVMAWLAFGEELGPVAYAGIVVTAIGVALVVRPQKPVT